MTHSLGQFFVIKDSRWFLCQRLFEQLGQDTGIDESYVLSSSYLQKKN